MPLCSLCRALRANSKTLTDCPISPCPYQQLVSENIVTPLHLYFISQIIDLDAIDDVTRSLPISSTRSIMTSLVHDFNECLKIPSVDVESAENELRKRFDSIRKIETSSSAAKMKKKIKSETQRKRSLCKMCTALRGSNRNTIDCPVKPCPYQKLVSDNVVTLLQLKFLGQLVQPRFIDSILGDMHRAEHASAMIELIYEFDRRLVDNRRGCVADLDPLEEKLRRTLDLVEAKEAQLVELKETLRERQSAVDEANYQLGVVALDFLPWFNAVNGDN